MGADSPIPYFFPMASPYHDDVHVMAIRPYGVPDMQLNAWGGYNAQYGMATHQRPALHYISDYFEKNQYTERYVEGYIIFTRILLRIL